MKFTKVSYRRLVKTEDYENQSLEVEAELENDDHIDDVFRWVKCWVLKNLELDEELEEFTKGNYNHESDSRFKLIEM
ncbi:MAG: hypothetical protein JSW06_02895 [Thermoplasmatales archaeon]|nr:MAG: hypothetical protein JSW06_02895 [Thermoplasmatales archaeon]